MFRVAWSTILPAGRPAPDGALSEIWLGRRQYPSGYRLAVSGARVLRRAADRVVLRGVPGAARVTLSAAPAPPAR